jgi:hypothetical protein
MDIYIYIGRAILQSTGNIFQEDQILPMANTIAVMAFEDTEETVSYFLSLGSPYAVQ